ncbi:MAG: peptidoglycan DD-metalloendopeptidase family protein [Bacteroidota bacterium]
MNDHSDIHFEEKNPDQDLSLDLKLEKPSFWQQHRYKLIGLFALVVICIIAGIFAFTRKHEGKEEVSAKESFGPSDKNEGEWEARIFQEYAEGIVLEEDLLENMTSEDEGKGLDFFAIQEIEQILSWTIGIRHLRKGDSLAIIWKVPIIEGQPQPRLKEIKALSLASASLDTMLYALLFEKDQLEAFYDEEGRPLKRKFLSSPVKYGRISSKFNLYRLNPVLKLVKAHRGTDFAAPLGTPILSLADGKITRMSENSANGKFVRITHDDVYRTTYLHMRAFNPKLKEGDRVQQGDMIGEVGTTGSSTGPHVCLRFYVDGYQGDFLSLFPHLPQPPQLPFAYLQQFFPHRDSLLDQLHAVWWER